MVCYAWARGSKFATHTVYASEHLCVYMWGLCLSLCLSLCLTVHNIQAYLPWDIQCKSVDISRRPHLNVMYSVRACPLECHVQRISDIKVSLNIMYSVYLTLK